MTNRKPAVLYEGRPALLTQQVADLIGCTTSNIRSLVRRDRIPRPLGKIGQSWVFDEGQIHTWIPGRARRGQRDRRS